MTDDWERCCGLGVPLPEDVPLIIGGYLVATRQGYLAPYTMLLYKHGLYVVGCRLRDPAHGRAIEPGAPIAVYAVERFTEAEHLRNTAFAAPPGFRITEILNGAFGIHVTIDATLIVPDDNCAAGTVRH